MSFVDSLNRKSVFRPNIFTMSRDPPYSRKFVFCRNVTRTELKVMDALEPFAKDVSGLAVIELGGADTVKFRRLRRVIPHIDMYIAVDICAETLFANTKKLAEDFLELEVAALCADYQQLDSFDFSALTGELTPMIFFPGSTIGNLDQREAVTLLKTCRRVVGNKGYMMMGCDLVKSTDILIPAYDDPAGVTARFNLNLLSRINAELGGDFVVEKFAHAATYNQEFHRIEMHLVSLEDQTVHLSGQSFYFRKGETIHTENAHKYTREMIEKMSRESSFVLQKWWTDPLSHVAVALLYAQESVACQAAAHDSRLADIKR